MLLVTACNPSPTPTSSGGPSRLPSPTADVRVGAADAYLTALTAYHGALDPVQQGVCASANTVPTLKSCWSQKLVIQRAFDAAVAAIVFPADIRGDVSTLHYTVGRLEAAMAGIARAPDPARDLADLGIFSSASVDFLQVTSNLREELGILPSPAA